MRVYPSVETVATLAGCSKKSVQRAKSWLESTGAVVVSTPGGRGRPDIVDFEPLARWILGHPLKSTKPESVRQKGDSPVALSSPDRVAIDSRLNVEEGTTMQKMGDLAGSPKGPSKDPLQGRTNQRSPIHISNLVPTEYYSNLSKSYVQEATNPTRPHFRAVIADAMIAYEQGRINPSDWGSLSAWWLETYGEKPSDKQLEILSRQINDRSGR